MNRWVAALAGITLLGIVLLGMMLFGESEPPIPARPLLHRRARSRPTGHLQAPLRPRVPGIGHVGMLNLLFGSDSGLSGQDAQGWSRAMLGGGGPPQDEHFGTVLGP
jgi:hypothetical protein